jgi:RHS repeat-associated protein
METPQKLTDTRGAMVWSAAYSAYGVSRISVEGVTNPLRLPGQYFDQETGLLQNWRRYFNPETGRYHTNDPLGLRNEVNSYAYAQDDPVNFIDPMGLQTCGSGSNEPFVPDNPLGFGFSPCCANHDDCYGTCGNPKTSTGLKVRATLVRRKYPKGIKPTSTEMAAVPLLPHDVLPEWNYTIAARAQALRNGN